jgi:hypothetical protein
MQLPLHHGPSFRRDQIPERIGGVIATDAILIGINLQHIFRLIWVMLEAWQCLLQAFAPSVDEQRPLQAGVRITQPLKHLRQPLTRSMLAGFSGIPSRPYCAAMVVPSL